MSVSDPPTAAHGRNRHRQLVIRAPTSTGARITSAFRPWSSCNVTGPRAPAAPNSDHGLLPQAPRISAPGAQTARPLGSAASSTNPFSTVQSGGP